MARLLHIVVACVALVHLSSAAPAAVPFTVIEPRDQLDQYDYIIVGGGTAGSVLASRLSEDKKTSILLIEAGGLDQAEDYITIPILAGKAQKTKYDWDYPTVPQKELNNMVMSIPAGKLIGGGSALNGMMLDRGAADNYNAWEELGNKGWGWKGLLPYFKKSETFTPPPDDIAKEYNITWDWSAHGNTGPIQSSFPVHQEPDSKVFFEAMTEFGIPTQLDHANGEAVNVFWTTNTQRPLNQSRSYARNEYFDVAVMRQNLHVILEHHVTKLIPGKKSGKDKKTTFKGVEYARDATSSRSTAMAKKEIILAGGAIGTVRVLQHSGIGPSSLLKKLNIPVQINLPGVGSNYQDHQWTIVVNSWDFPSPAASGDPSALYHNNRSGPWTKAIANNIGYIPLSTLSSQKAANNWSASLRSQAPETYLRPGTHRTVLAGFKKQKDILARQIATSNVGAAEFIWQNGTFMMSTALPVSRGYIEISSKNPFDYPIMDPAYFVNPLDWEIALNVFKFARKVAQTKTLQQYNIKEVSPGAELDTDEKIMAWFRDNWFTEYHSSCTCPMMPLEMGGVVDTETRVYGTENVRIVDASIFPMIPGAHTQATVYAVAEKAADIIRGAKP